MNIMMAGIILLVLSSVLARATGDTVHLSCRHINNRPVNVLNLTTLSLQSIMGVSYSVNLTTDETANVFIESECCETIAVSSSRCSRRCTETGMKLCNLQSNKTLQLDLSGCLNAVSVNVSCYPYSGVLVTSTTTSTSTLIMDKTLASPNSSTTNHTMSTSQSPITSITSIANDKSNTTEAGNGSGTVTAQLNVPTTTEGVASNTSRNVGQLDNTTATIINNNTNDRSTVTTNGTSTVPTFDEHKAMEDLRTFLIVLGVVLVCVITLVIVFFRRKKRAGMAVSRSDYPLEYWHEQDFVDNSVDKGICSKYTSFTVNPVYDSKSSNKANSQTMQRYYKKKDESAHKSRCPNGDSNPRSRYDNDLDEHSEVKDVHRRSSKYLTGDKYVATAAGSNYYSYTGTPRGEEPSTNLDDSDQYDHLDDNAGHCYGNTGHSSFQQPRDIRKEGRKKRRGSSESRSRGSSDKRTGDTRDDVDDEDGDDNQPYAISYKNRLRKRLDDWSAEESDV